MRRQLSRNLLQLSRKTKVPLVPFGQFVREERKHSWWKVALGSSAIALCSHNWKVLADDNVQKEQKLFGSTNSELRHQIASRAFQIVKALGLPEESLIGFSHLFFGDSEPGKSIPPGEISALIDHTLLGIDSSFEDIAKLCWQADHYKFAAVCVNGSRVEEAIKILGCLQPGGRKTKVAAVVGFPLGASTIESKVCEAVSVALLGADEIDVVLNIGKLKEGDYHYVFTELVSIVAVAKHEKPNIVVKVILETTALNEVQIVDASILSVLAGADYVKTSTGLLGGASEGAVFLMKLTVGPHTLVKASGGIRTYEDAQKMVHVGASRIGSSAGVTIAEQAKLVK